MALTLAANQLDARNIGYIVSHSPTSGYLTVGTIQSIDRSPTAVSLVLDSQRALVLDPEELVRLDVPQELSIYAQIRNATEDTADRLDYLVAKVSGLTATKVCVA